MSNNVPNKTRVESTRIDQHGAKLVGHAEGLAGLMPALFTRLALLATVAGTAARRVLHPTDLHYDLDTFNKKFNTRVPSIFGAEAERFHRRLFEHESSLPDGRLQTFLARLHPAHGASSELTASLEERADGLTMHTVVGGDLMMHGTREHADALREQPEVHAVVPLLPELKVSPHFDALLPKLNPSAAVSLNVRLVPLERHEHVRRPAATLVEELRQVKRPSERFSVLIGPYGSSRALLGPFLSPFSVPSESFRDLLSPSESFRSLPSPSDLFRALPISS